MKSRFLPLLAGLVLAACAGQPAQVEVLPSEEVLQRATQAAQKLDSAQYLVTADVDIDSGNTWQADGIVRMDGILQNAGDQLRTMTDITAEVEDEVQGDYSLNGTVELVVMDKDDEVYLNIHSLTSQPNSTLFPPEVIGQLAGTWWRLPANDTVPASASVTPDPRLLQAQAQVVTVTKDNGVVPFAGSDAYHYDVVLNKDKLQAYILALAEEGDEEIDRAEVESALQNAEATGQIWIDAHNFFLHKLTWEVRSLAYATNGTLDLDLTVTFRNHNAAPRIEPPTGAKMFSPAALFALPTDPYFDDVPTGDNEALDDILQDFSTYE